MFDSLYDSDNNEWQTKAYENMMASYREGDQLPELEEHPEITDYQVEILGTIFSFGDNIDSFATVIGNKLITIHDSRNMNLPRIDYHGYKCDPNAERELAGEAGE